MLSLFVLNKCPYCDKKPLRSARNLRYHLATLHTIMISEINQRRKDVGDVQFVKTRTPNTEDVFGCCFCCQYYSEPAVLRKHIEEHLWNSVAKGPSLRKRKYKVMDVQEEEYTVDKGEKWEIGELKVMDTLFLLRKQIVKRNEKLERISDVEILVLDHIYFFAHEHQDSIPGFELEQHRQIIQNIGIMNLPRKEIGFLLQWCSKLLKAQDICWDSLKKVTTSFLVEATASSDPNQLVAADIIHSLAPRLLKTKDKKMLEDTYVHRYVDVLLDTVFGSESRFQYDWANGSLLRNKPQQKSEEGMNSSSSDDADEVDENNQGNNSNTLLYKPDWVVYAKAGSLSAPVGIMELKVDYKRNPNYLTDFVKLGKQMKLILHELIYAGVQAPVVCGILVQDDQCETFAMDLIYNGTYRMMRLGKGALCMSLQQFGMFPAVFTNIIELKDIAMATALSIEQTQCARQLGREIPPTTPLSWLRPSAGFLKRLDN